MAIKITGRLLSEQEKTRSNNSFSVDSAQVRKACTGLSAGLLFSSNGVCARYCGANRFRRPDRLQSGGMAEGIDRFFPRGTSAPDRDRSLRTDYHVASTNS